MLVFKVFLKRYDDELSQSRLDLGYLVSPGILLQHTGTYVGGAGREQRGRRSAGPGGPVLRLGQNPLCASEESREHLQPVSVSRSDLADIWQQRETSSAAAFIQYVKTLI